jgi:hypothetical protein
LFIEDTKLFILETNTAEAEGAGFKKIRIEDSRTMGYR